MSPRKETTCPGNICQNSEWTTRCVGCCTILLKPHIFCSMFIEMPIGGHRYSNIVLFEKVRTPNTKLRNGTPHSNLGTVEWPLVNFRGYCETSTGNVVCWLCLKGWNVSRETAILNELLGNKSELFIRPRYGVNWERHEHSCLTT
jgi:hypothetical protein